MFSGKPGKSHFLTENEIKDEIDNLISSGNFTVHFHLNDTTVSNKWVFSCIITIMLLNLSKIKEFIYNKQLFLSQLFFWNVKVFIKKAQIVEQGFKLNQSKLLKFVFR